MSGSVDVLTADDRLAILRLQVRFLGTPVSIWAYGDQTTYVAMPEMAEFTGSAEQIELSEVTVGPTYQFTWRKFLWPDRFSCRAGVATFVPHLRAVIYRQGTAKWHLPPPRGTVVDVVGRHRPFAVEVDRAGICHRPGSWIGCKARILWTITASGGKLPLNWQPRVDGKFVPHWATCPHARHFRKRPR